MDQLFLQKLAMTVKKKRKEKSLTQQELAGISGVGLRFIVELESGQKSTLQIGKILQVLKRLGIKIDINEKS